MSRVRHSVDDDYKTVEIGPQQFTVPKEWELKRIPEICDLSTESFDPEEHDEDSFEYIDIESVSAGKIEGSKTTKVEDAPSRAKQIVKEGDTLIGKVRPYLRAFAPVTERYDGCVCSTGFAVLSANEVVDDEYLTQATLSKYFLDQMTNRMTGTSYPAVNKSDFENVRIFVPPLEEQRRIADVLSKVDTRMQEADESVRVLDDLKWGLMQNFFRPNVSGGRETSLGEIPNDWQVGQIRDFDPEFIAGGTPSRSNNEYFGGEIPWLKTGAVQNSRVKESEEFLTRKGLDESTAKLVPSGAVLVAMYGGGTVGNVGLLEFKATTNQACCAILTENSELDNEFLYYQLLFEHRRLVSYAAGASQQNLSKHDIEQFDIVVPPMNEQKQIAQILSTVEKRADQEMKAKAEFQELKRGLMQDLLTGKRRLKTDT